MFGDPQQQQLQYLTQTPPSSTPSPGQPHQHPHYHQGPQPSPAGGGPQYAQAAPQAQQFQMMCPLLPQPLAVQQYFPGGGQPQHHPTSGHIQVLLPQQHPQQ